MTRKRRIVKTINPEYPIFQTEFDLKRNIEYYICPLCLKKYTKRGIKPHFLSCKGIITIETYRIQLY